MTFQIDLEISFSSKQILILLSALLNIEPFSLKNPTVITTITYDDGFTRVEGDSDWINKWILKAKEHEVTAYWGYDFLGEHEEGFIIYDPKNEVITIKINDYKLTNPESVIKSFESLPWTVANFYQIHNDCGWDEYIAPGFINGHGGHGWACAFKAKGHSHLVSNRWLDFGPWRLIRDETNDISFVQFHDLNADPATALEQAKPGHRAMSIYGVGGYIGKNHPFSNDLRGIYVPETQNLRVVIPAGKEITYSEMADYCAARHFQAFEGNPVKTLSFVFIDGAEALPYLHDLWLREIECFGITPKAVEIRFDENYNPTPDKPEWVRKLEESDG